VLAQLAAVCARLSTPLAVRSSGVGEDSATISYAGQHATVLNVQGIQAVNRAVEAVWRSASSEAALAYRRRVGASPAARIGVVVQEMVAADVAGVLFTRDPVTGADEIVVEATWGLGEAIVQGLVIPDRYHIARNGEVLEQTAGFKQLAIRPRPDGQTCREPVERELAEKQCLDGTQLHGLHQLAARCDDVYGTGPHDIEWALAADTLHLLQRRPVTTSLIRRELPPTENTAPPTLRIGSMARSGAAPVPLARLIHDAQRELSGQDDVDHVHKVRVRPRTHWG
jgi:pyruvate, water dikinase